MWHDVHKTRKWWVVGIILPLVVVFYILIDGRKTDVAGKVVVCIPVYGQSLALGEEAARITDFEQFASQYEGRIVTENIDDKFGYFDASLLKQYVKRLLHYRKRSFELSVYGMAESLAKELGPDTVICIFPGGQGATALAHLSKGTAPYNRFIADIEKASKSATKGGARFYLPAICWMQGESDIDTYPDTDYEQLLQQFVTDINHDVKRITHQSEDVRIICYQTNAVTKGERFSENDYQCVEAKVPQAMSELLRDDTLFWASGPTYPYPFVREYIHIDGISQKRIGYLAAKSALGILRKSPRQIGLQPLVISSADSTVFIHFNVPHPPLVFDTINVAPVPNYGFKVIRQDGTDIATTVTIKNDTIAILCAEAPKGCKVRYAINGTLNKSGYRIGPRGNLRDSQGEDEQVLIAKQHYPQHNWCYQFDETLLP